LILHGDADKLVPIQQAELVLEKLKSAGVETKLVVKKGAQHGWPDFVKDLSIVADWFDAHLKPKTEDVSTSKP
jgi:dipeptidyl aminopeptidase/acylaminoacyl peptidase